MKTNEIARRVRRLFNHEYQLENIFMYFWESDYFGLTKAGYAVEVEIKVSRSDFLADARNKKKKFKTIDLGHKDLVVHRGFTHRAWMKEPDEKNPPYSTVTISAVNCPNRFYYACPEGLIKKEEIPDYAGLIYIYADTNGYMHAREVKKSKVIHKRKFDKWQYLLTKYYFLSIKLRNQNESLQGEIRHLREQNESVI